jgi:ABC-type taurine transport system ATPase subunit
VVRDQGVCCIIGPSGCGKTTLIRIIGGFLEATSGTVKLDGVEIRGPGADRGVVFQEYALFPWMTVMENAEFGLRMKGVPKADRRERVMEYLEMVGLAEFSGAATYNLSGGMQQRVAIVRALVNDPEILLMDEPFGALDALTREEMEIELIKIWKKTNKTIVFITHDVEEAAFLSTQLVILSPRPGKIKEILDLSFAKNFPITGGLKEARFLKTNQEFIDIRTSALRSIWGERTS